MVHFPLSSAGRVQCRVDSPKPRLPAKWLVIAPMSLPSLEGFVGVMRVLPLGLAFGDCFPLALGVLVRLVQCLILLTAVDPRSHPLFRVILPWCRASIAPCRAHRHGSAPQPCLGHTCNRMAWTALLPQSHDLVLATVMPIKGGAVKGPGVGQAQDHQRLGGPCMSSTGGHVVLDSLCVPAEVPQIGYHSTSQSGSGLKVRDSPVLEDPK